MEPTVRVRFAPSPTGPLHIGGVRTALFNYLFAKKNKGVFVLRIEDTDQNRYVEGAEDYIKEALEWCGFPYDEGPGKEGAYAPYRQSERRQLYRRYVLELIDNGAAYYAFDSSEALEKHRRSHEKKGKTFIYNWHNRLTLENSLSLPEEETQKRLKRGDAHVIRFKSPENKAIILTDVIRGKITVNSKILDDKILFKSDGMPTYHLANVVDDHLMKITHVIRGEEWLPSLALHYLLYDGFGWTKPEFAHLPLILKPNGNGKLSKRDGELGGFPIFPLAWKESTGYREAGYFSEAVINFLAFLGWNPTTEKEVFSMQELIASFGLDMVNKAGARFDPDKTKWYNQQWLQRKSTTELTTLYRKELNEKKVVFNEERLEKIVGLVRERAVFTNDLWELTHYFFETPNTYDDRAVKKKWKEGTPQLMEQLVELLHSIENFTSGTIGKVVKDWIASNHLSFGQVMPPLRLLIVGDLKGPDLFDIMALLGKGECILRIDNGLKVL